MYRIYLSNFYNTLFQILLVILGGFQNFILSIKEEGISFSKKYLLLILFI